MRDKEVAIVTDGALLSLGWKDTDMSPSFIVRGIIKELPGHKSFKATEVYAHWKIFALEMKGTRVSNNSFRGRLCVEKVDI